MVGKEEWLFLERLVKSTVSLARHLQALSAAIRMQWTLLHEENIISDTPSLRSFVTEDIHLSPSVLNMTHAMPCLCKMKHTIRCSYLTCLYNTLHLRLNHLYSQSKGVGEVPFENFSEETQIGLFLLLPYSIH